VNPNWEKGRKEIISVFSNMLAIVGKKEKTKICIGALPVPCNIRESPILPAC
jgi:hypothetical protein